MKDVVVERAVRGDLAGVRALLADAELPVEGIEDQFPDSFSVARNGPSIVAVAAVERYGDFGLLRSVAVRGRDRGKQLGSSLVRERLRIADDEHVSSVYLLTTTAPEFFLRFGFIAIPRAGVPAEIASSPEFRSICPSTAVCLVRR